MILDVSPNHFRGDLVPDCSSKVSVLPWALPPYISRFVSGNSSKMTFAEIAFIFPTTSDIESRGGNETNR